MRRVLMAAMLTTFFGGNAALAQIGGTDSIPALEATSPLGIGPGSPVAPTGIPMGATELASPGVSPLTSGATPLAPSVDLSCFGTGTLSGTGISSAGMSTFDGGGVAGTASGTCPSAGGALARPAASASSPTGMGSAAPVARAGVPLGSTELGAGGLSPPPDVLTLNPSAPVSTAPCPAGVASSTSAMSSTIGTTSTTGMSTSSGSC